MWNRCARLWCMLPLLICLCLPAHAADKLRIQLTGTLIRGSAYSSPVSLQITGAAQDDRILIREKGRWMVLSPDEDGQYRLNFTEDGDYRLRFCAEAPDSGRSGFADARFTIDGETAAFIEGCRRLPETDQVEDGRLPSMAQELIALQRQQNALDERQRALVPTRLSRTLSTLLERLGALQPQLDILAPAAPQLLLRGEAAAGNAAVYRADVRIEITPPQQDFARLYMRDDGEWEPLEAADGVYAVECGASGEYCYDFCAEDAAVNRSGLSRAEFTISPGLFDFYEQVGQKTGFGVEQALMRYQRFDARGSSLVDEVLIRQLWWDYWRSCEQFGHTALAHLGGRELRVLGMLSGFYGKGPVQLAASGQAAPGGKTAAGKQLLWEYTLSFTDEWEREAESSTDLLVSVQLPPELLKKKNVAVVDADGNLLESSLRNEDEGFVLTFPVRGGGVYSVGADA